MLEEKTESIKMIEVRKKFVNPVEMILGGSIIMICGIVLTLSRMNPYLNSLDPIFVMVLEYFGLSIVLQGGIVLLRGVIGNNWVSLHQFMIVVQVILSLASIGLLVVLYYNPSAIPFYLFDETSETFVRMQFPFELRWIQLGISVIIALVIVGALSDIYKAGKLEKFK